MAPTGNISAFGLLYGPAQKGNSALALNTKTENIHVWFDKEADLLEVSFEDKIGYFKETEDDRVMVRGDMEDRIIGFHNL
jgi:hypothetical protein